MHICYVDEAGCTGALPSAASDIQPVFALVGLFVPVAAVKQLTVDWMQLKQRHFPGLLAANPAPRFHDWMKAEVKGSEIRRRAKMPSRNSRRFATHFIGQALDLMETHHVRIAGRVFIKPIGGPFGGIAVYTSATQGICATFQSYLSHHKTSGLVIADGRTKALNATLSHSIFTQRHSARGDPYPGLLEAPTFGHSDNHAGLQLADIVCSALLFPIAAQVCSAVHLTDHTHCSPQFLALRDLFGQRLRALQWLYGPAGQSGGITLKDQLNRRRVTCLFAEPPAALVATAVATAMVAATRP